MKEFSHKNCHKGIVHKPTSSLASDEHVIIQPIKKLPLQSAYIAAGAQQFPTNREEDLSPRKRTRWFLAVEKQFGWISRNTMPTKFNGENGFMWSTPIDWDLRLGLVFDLEK